MVRTQIYLTNKERSALKALSVAKGKKQSELIREAIDRMIEQNSSARSTAILKRAAGLWRHRTDLPDFRSLRSEWDR